LAFVLYLDRAVIPKALAGIKLSMNRDEVLNTIGNQINIYPDLDDSYRPLGNSNPFTLARIKKSSKVTKRTADLSL
jgi:hypothetical protein